MPHAATPGVGSAGRCTGSATHPCTICSLWLPTFCPASSTNMTVSLLAFWVASPAAVCSALRDAELSSGLLSRMASRICSYFTTSDCSRGDSRGEGEARKAQIPTHLGAAEGARGAGGGAGGLPPWRREILEPSCAAPYPPALHCRCC